MTSAGTIKTLYGFCRLANCTDENNPLTSVVQASDGNFYGTTYYGGRYNEGIMFKITSTGALTTLYSFGSALNDSGRASSLLQATDGNLYGTSSGGGTYNEGAIFSITLGGTLTTLYSFTGTTARPLGPLVQATSGNFYGTSEGGTSGDGTLFALSMGLGPFIGLLPTSSAVGRQVGILGNGLTGATSVTFNGVSATFAVQSSTFITATVPSGATTGPAQVATPSGTLTSNVPFRVEP